MGGARKRKERKRVENGAQQAFYGRGSVDLKL
jgi:hypothetical protein